MQQNILKPIFIIGNPRSGTSMFRLMLTTHKDIVIAPESGFLIWWKEKYQNWDESCNITRLDEFIVDLFSSRRFEYWELDENELTAFIASKNPISYSELMSLVYMSYAKKLGKTNAIWGDKNNYYLNHILEIYELYPHAKFIHIIRDGRDVATSYLKLKEIKNKVHLAPDLPHEIAQIAKTWSENIAAINKGFECIPENNKYSIRYEDIVNDAEGSLKMLCDFLSLQFDPNMLNFNEYNKKHQLVPSDYMSWKSETFKKLNKNAIGKWKDKLTDEDVELFVSITNKHLVNYKYI